jgi:hypothetical protein
LSKNCNIQSTCPKIINLPEVGLSCRPEGRREGLHGPGIHGRQPLESNHRGGRIVVAEVVQVGYFHPKLGVVDNDGARARARLGELRKGRGDRE